ncbi:MAG: NAD(P)H-binding protein [SAR86 cluster bacterium]|tara:strand:- start:567 stop:1454 length:888 start_codon:yes stop_codon:yes gene_type:complete
MKLAITGANGHLGRRLIKTLKDQHEIIAIVRSSAARQRLAQEVGGLVTVVECDYGNAASLAAVLADVDYVVHLPGIIKESRANTFQMAHEDAAAALLLATAGTKVQGILYLSILGAHIDSTNACLASKARAEKLLLAGVVPARMIKVPMVLGEGDFASRALAKKARRSLNLDFHAASLEQPIYAGDVIAAIISSVNGEPSRDVVELAGPESLTRRALIKRAGWVLGRQPRVISLPLWPGLMVAGLLELLLSAPPVTRAMLGVLDHDDAVDTAEAAKHLGVRLTSLDVMLAAVLAR